MPQIIKMNLDVFVFNILLRPAPQKAASPNADIFVDLSYVYSMLVYYYSSPIPRTLMKCHFFCTPPKNQN